MAIASDSTIAGIAQVAAAAGHQMLVIDAEQPERFAALHALAPVPAMTLVEGAPGTEGFATMTATDEAG